VGNFHPGVLMPVAAKPIVFRLRPPQIAGEKYGPKERPRKNYPPRGSIRDGLGGTAIDVIGKKDPGPGEDRILYELFLSADQRPQSLS
jgi:hypothetical protein